METKEIVDPLKNRALLELYRKHFSKQLDYYRHDLRKYDFHEVIEEILIKFNPENFPLLVAEYPHRSVNNSANVAYTRDIRSGSNDRQVSTSFGKYIRKHFPSLKDHEVRDYATKVNTDKFELWDTLDDIVKSVQLGPRSCMQWDQSYTPGSESYDVENKHPYLAYDPALGWKAAVRLRETDNIILGRALVYETEEFGKGFVRSYKRGTDYSYSDEFLEVWLKDQGYEHWGEWPEGTELRYITNKSSFLAPYLDGDNQRVDDYPSSKILKVSESGEYTLDNTDGYPAEEDNSEYCSCCDEYHDEDDMRNTEDGQYDRVCQWCLDGQFVEAIGFRGRIVTIHEDNVVYCDWNGENYDRDYLDENGITELYNGEYAPVNDCITHGISGEHYILCHVKEDSDMIIIDDYCYDMSDVFFCEGSKEYYVLEEVDPVQIDDKFYHPDYAPELKEE
jgi:hypothetical protein